MYAVIKTGGKQYRVAAGSTLKVEKLDAAEGSSVELGQVLMIADGDNLKIGTPLVDGGKVTATIKSHARGKKIAIVGSRFNDFFTGELMEGALDCLRRHGVADDDVTVAWVPGSYEIPLTAKMMVERGDLSGVVCLGALIRGGTPHFDYVAGECVKGITAAGMRNNVPIGNGVLTVDTIEQAIERAGTKAGNKGAEAAMSAIEMANLLRHLES